MSALHQASTIYVDFENMIVRTDEFVCAKLYTLLKGDERRINQNPFHAFFEIIDNLGEEYIRDFCDTKKTLNPFREIIDISAVSENELKPYIDAGYAMWQIEDILCRDLYYSILNYEYNYDIIDEFKYTNLANSIKILLKDNHLQKVYIYVSNLTDTIRKSIYDHYMNNSKVVIVTGDKRAFFKQYSCDVYLCQNLEDLLLLPLADKTTDEKSDFIFLNKEFNVFPWENEYSDEDHSHTSICDAYNVNVSILNNL